MNRTALVVVILVVVLIVGIAAIVSMAPDRGPGEPGPADGEPADSGRIGAPPALPNAPSNEPLEAELLATEGAAEVAEAPTPLPEGAVGAVSGRVLDRRGEPVAEAVVEEAQEGLFPVPGAAARPTARTSEDGSFVLSGVKRQVFDVTASKAGFAPTTVKAVRSGQAGLQVVLADLGSIEGIVLLADGRKPAGDFRVQANAAVGRIPGFPGMEAVGKAEVLPEGRFRISGLAPGSYRVSAFAENLAPGRIADVEVKEGETAGGIEILLDKGGNLAGLVVSDLEGTPIAGATVSASLSDNPAFQMTGMGEKREGKTDAEGRFLLEGIPEGSTHVRITHDDYAGEVLSGVSVPTKFLEVRLKAGGGLIVRLLRADGSPIVGAMAILQRQLPFTQIQKAAGLDGVVRFEHVPAGPWILMKIDPQAMVKGGFGGAGMQFKNVTVVEGESAEVELKPDVGATVRGRVLRGGDGVPGAMIYIMRVGEAANALEGMKFGFCDESGAFAIENIEDGEYTLMVTKGAGVVPTHSEKITVALGRELEVEVVLPPATASGRVTDDRGEGIPGVQVTLTPASLASFRAGQTDESMQAFAGMATTAEDGSFTFDGLRPGTYVARGWIEGRASAYSEAFTIPGLGNGPDDVRIVLPAGVDLVVVVRGPDRRPLAGAFVFATDAQGRILPVSMMFAAQTDTEGRAKLRLAAGEHHIEVQPTGLPAVHRVARAPGTLELDIPSPGSLSVVVTGADGVPLVGARVDLLDPAGAGIGRRATGATWSDALVRTRTVEGGLIEFPVLAPGTYRVRATTEDGRSVETKADVVSGRDTQVSLSLGKE